MVKSTSTLEFVPDIRDLPILLRNWRICEATNVDGKKSIHFVGDWGAIDHRVSSEICLVLLTPEYVWGLTKTGAPFKLYGSSAFSKNAFHTWIKWCEMKKVTKERDVTSKYTSR